MQRSTHSGRMAHLAAPEVKLISPPGESMSGAASSPSSGSGSRSADKSVLVSDAVMRTERSARFFILPNSESMPDHSSTFNRPRSFNSCSRSKVRRLVMEIQVIIEELRVEKSLGSPRPSRNRWSILVASSAPDRSCLTSSRTCGRATKNATSDCRKFISSSRVEGEPYIGIVSKADGRNTTREPT
jgi:hypothetical protein